MVSGILITAIYAWIVYQRHLQGSIDLTTDYKSWGVVFLIFIGVSIVARIIIMIIFHIINAIATREEDVPENTEDVEIHNSSMTQTPNRESDKNKVEEIAVEIADLISEINNNA